MLKYLLLFLVAQSAYALDGKVVQLQGNVTWVNATKGVLKLASGTKISEGAVIKTADKSFVKILLSDQTNITVGPKSEITIQKQPGTEIGLINIVTGKVRAAVEKGEKDGPPKFIVKTPRCSMGVRGTDFRADYNSANNMSSILTFDGAVQLGKVPEGGTGMEPFTGDSASVSVGVGQFSAESPQLPDIVAPVIINPAQMELLEANDTFEEPAKASESKFGSAVPDGVGGKAFAPEAGAVAASVGVALTAEDTAEGDSEKPALLSEGGLAQGGFFSEQAGYIPPPEGSLIDENTGLPMAANDAGGIDADGNYQPPPGLGISDSGQFFALSDSVDISMSDIPQVVGAAETTTLMTESGEVVPFMSDEPMMNFLPDAPPGQEFGQMEGPGGDFVMDDTLGDLIDEIIQNNIDTITDLQNTTTTNASSTTTMSIGSVQ